ncbi:MAG: cobalt ECF transporter T component CbiQ [Acidimicrobiales bacterium]
MIDPARPEIDPASDPGGGGPADRPTARPTPEWLVRPQVGLCPCGCVGRRSRAGFLARTIRGLAELTRQAVLADEIATRPGLLQRLDPRTKVLGLLVLLVTASLTHEVALLAALYLLSLVVAVASAVPLGGFLRRVWLTVPLFTAFVVLPATTNLITPGEVVVPLGTWFGHPVGLTAQGLGGALLLVSRVAVSVSLALLVTITTSWPRLLEALRTLKVPRTFVTVGAMAYRYVFVLAEVVTDRYTARVARTVRRERARAGRSFVVASAGALFGRAHQLSGEVHDAMIARGYVGESRTLDPPAFGVVDLAALGGLAVVATSVLLAGRALAG